MLVAFGVTWAALAGSRLVGKLWPMPRRILRLQLIELVAGISALVALAGFGRVPAARVVAAACLLLAALCIALSAGQGIRSRTRSGRRWVRSRLRSPSSSYLQVWVDAIGGAAAVAAIVHARGAPLPDCLVAAIGGAGGAGVMNSFSLRKWRERTDWASVDGR